MLALRPECGGAERCGPKKSHTRTLTHAHTHRTTHREVSAKGFLGPLASVPPGVGQGWGHPVARVLHNSGLAFWRGVLKVPSPSPSSNTPASCVSNTQWDGKQTG